MVCDRRVARLLVLEAHPDSLPAHAAGVVDEDIELSAADGADFLCSALGCEESVRPMKSWRVGMEVGPPGTRGPRRPLRRRARS